MSILYILLSIALGFVAGAITCFHLGGPTRPTQ